jgi:hypothetical protein
MSLLSDFKSKQEYLLCLLNGGWSTTDERFIQAATKMQHSVLEVINATHGLSVAEATEVLGMLNIGPFPEKLRQPIMTAIQGSLVHGDALALARHEQGRLPMQRNICIYIVLSVLLNGSSSAV